MRILQVTQAYYPFLERGGPAVKVHAMARGLARRGHTVTVLTADLGLHEKFIDLKGLQESRWGWRTMQESVETIYLRSLAAYRALTLNPQVMAFCRERLKSFDVVHIYGFYDLFGPAVARSCLRAHLPYVLEPMGMFRPIVRSVLLKKAYRYLVGDSVALGATRLIATAEQEKEELTEEGVPAQKIIVRRNGIEVPDRRPGRGTFRKQWAIPEGTPVVLFLGRLVTKKSPELLLEAFARWQCVASAGPRSKLVLSGPAEQNDYEQELGNLAKRLGIGPQVIFTGPLYDDAKWAAYSDADLFVLPSQNENFGNTAAEAVVCGTPVLVTDCCGIAPMIEGRAGLVVRHNCNELSAALERFFADENLRNALITGCGGLAGELNWEQPLAETETLYSALLREASSAA